MDPIERPALARKAHAKLNLMLSVGAPCPQGTDLDGKDVSGFHPIASWMAPISLHDDVTVQRLSPGSPSTYDIAFATDAARPETVNWPLERDLCVRAHRALEAAIGQPLPIALTVRKRIPTGAGLGGGSSDAAATILALRDAFPEIEFPDDDALEALAMTLGSDIAYFLDPGSVEEWPRQAIVESFGEKIDRVEGVTGRALLVVTSLSCATGPVYQAFDKLLAAELAERARDAKGRQPSTDPKVDMIRQRQAKALTQGVREELFFNDLAKPAFSIEPRLGALATALASMTRLSAHVTGSGSAIFLWPEGSRLAPKDGGELGSGAASDKARVDAAKFDRARDKATAAAETWANANGLSARVIEIEALA
jgi:4-diphosphocytidyl-2-C-methyl-D-erythritol kinase